MREIEFRGMTLNSKEFVYSMTISKGTIKSKMHQVFFEITQGKWVGVIPETVGQFTGLLDKNSKKTFEKDIIKYSSDIGEVVFGSYGAFCAHFKNIGTGIKTPLLNLMEQSICSSGNVPLFEVIGNIHENPELLAIK